jgi:phosphoribosylformimino-5-aminoimidazole carboxamide ribotide isomerase
MLVIPEIAIRGGISTMVPVGDPGTEGSYPDNPVLLARLFRNENARSLHIVDLDSIQDGKAPNLKQVRAIVDAVEIPIQYQARLRTSAEVRMAFDEAGVYRVVLPASCFQGRPEHLTQVLNEFGPRKIVLSMDVEGGRVVLQTDEASISVPLITYALEIKRAGVERVLYTSMRYSQSEMVPVEDIVFLAEATGLSVTIAGCVQNYSDLSLIQSLQIQNIDSVVLGSPFYSNAFPCQKTWRSIEKQLILENNLLHPTHGPISPVKKH